MEKTTIEITDINELVRLIMDTPDGVILEINIGEDDEDE